MSISAITNKANNGDVDAQCTLADIYADDTNLEIFDVSKAVYWYERVAEQGHTRAQWLLGACYSQGIGIGVDQEKAEHWMLKSAHSGDVEGQFNLGSFYFMKPDIVKAEYWIEKASNQGHVEAQSALGAIKLLM
ncbi:MAG: sel1 repeat family protein [Oscillospiraceae bacterium]|jgi:TPR repeat protein|nr:sel1 repeat family protein [Oscillospiraceae bacterium]